MNQPIFVGTGSLWKQVERASNDSDRLPLFHRLAWAEHNHKSRHCLLTLRDSHGDTVPCVAVQIDDSRVLPRHQHLRVMRFGHGLPQAAWEPTIAALSNLARSDAKVLRLSVGIFSRQHRSDLAALLQAHGFQRTAQPQSYRHTLTVDLQPEPAEILSGLHKTARKNFRAVEKSPLFLRDLTDTSYAARLCALQSESMSRTGRTNATLDWHSILNLSHHHPELSRVVGLFTSEAERDPGALLGFGWGCMHGDHGEYRAAGTTRKANLNLPVSYPLLWDLMLWARQRGASWFDLGGVTLADSADEPLTGISDFKRYFSRTVEEVGEEWNLEPHPARSHMAALLGRGARGSVHVLSRVSRTA